MTTLPETSDALRPLAMRMVLTLAVAYFLLEWLPGWLGTYGYFIDELYYIACSDRLAFGYVDHPPLSILLLRVLRWLAGDSLPILRLLPAACGAAVILLTADIARRLGAGAFGQVIAALAAMVGTIFHIVFSYYSMNALSVLIWAACFWILVEIERRGEPRLWLAFGALAGLGLESKHTIVLLALGLAVGLVLTPARRHLGNRWIWLGLGLALLLFLPNVLWQIDQGWPSLEFYRNADLYKNVPTPPLEVLMQQVLTMNPGALPVWSAGLFFFLVSKRGRRYRHLGWLYVALLLLMVVAGKSRPDRLAPAYVILFAGGGVALEALARQNYGRWLRLVLPLLLVACGAFMAPLGLPLLPPEPTAAFAARLGVVPQIEAGEGKQTELPQWLADRFGWEELASDVEAVVAELSSAERQRAIILAPSYGQAGAIELHGRGRDLPPVYASQNSYFHWGPPEDKVSAAVILGFEEETLRQYFDQVELARTHECDWCMPWRDNYPIWVARGQRFLFQDVWPRLRHYE